MENVYVGETVQMMPQDEIKSENDLGFMTEVDAEFKLHDHHMQGGKESQTDERRLSTRHSEVEGNTSMPPQNQSSLLEIEQAEFKMVIKEICAKE